MIRMDIEFLGPDDFFFKEGELCREDTAVTLGISPQATASGRPGVLIKIEGFDATGQTVVIPTTARLFVTMAKMIEAKFPDLMKD